jgi:DNA-binding NarL/FixJ family response regulator
VTYEELGLTPRQAEIARLARAGFTDKEIGQQIGLTEAGVGYHMTNILRTLCIKGRLDLVRVLKGVTK